MKKFAANTVAAIALATLTSTAHATPIQMQDTDIRDFVRWYVEPTPRWRFTPRPPALSLSTRLTCLITS